MRDSFRDHPFEAPNAQQRAAQYEHWSEYGIGRFQETCVRPNEPGRWTDGLCDAPRKRHEEPA